MAIERGGNRPPTKELQGLIEAIGYQVLAMDAEHRAVGLGEFYFTGVINLKIAPASFFPESEELPSFTKIPIGLADLALERRGCAAQPPSSKSNPATLSMDGMSDAFTS